MPEIIVKDYEHFNKAFKSWDTPKGKYIRTKHEYNEAMKREGFVSQERAEQLYEKRTRKRQETHKRKLSRKARDIIRSAKPDKNGKVKLGTRQIKALEEMGIEFNLDKLRKIMGKDAFNLHKKGLK